MRDAFLVFALVWMAAVTFPLPSFAQASESRFALGFKASSLGLGVEASTRVTARSNLRGAFSAFNYNRDGIRQGIRYDAALHLRSVQISFDQYLIGGFHVGPGVLLYNGSDVGAVLTVPPGQSFTIGDNQFFSNVNDPITGSTSVQLGTKVAPMILAGFGNPLPRSSRRIGINFDFGVVLQGSPSTTLGLNGTACVLSPTAGCVSANNDLIVQSVRLEEGRINEDLELLRFYPVFSFGLSWKFR